MPSDPDLDETVERKLAQQTPPSIDGLVEQFKIELEAVAAEFMLATSVAEAMVHVRAILDQENESSIAIAGAETAAMAAHLPVDIAILHPEQWAAHERAAKAAAIRTGLVTADYAIADSATLAVSFARMNSTLPLFLPECVVALVRKERLITNLFELFKKMAAEEARDMLLITGPSRTADIEKILILGAHGPRRLVVILIDEK